MAAPTFYWHDYETFGANPRLDRPAQFAGQRTDLDLNPIGEPLVVYCQPSEDLLPQPEAVLITGITPQVALERGLPEPAFIAAVHAELSAPGGCAVGYNSLRFDDELTRHALWRNFFDPYRREWDNGCSRWDIIDMLRLTYALRPQGIVWPQREDGAPSFRLADLAAANQLEQERAHDALSDVTATIALAKLVRTAQPRLYDFVLANRGKREARALLRVGSGKPVLHTSNKFPAKFGSTSLVLPLAPHPTNNNAVLCFDLRADPAPLLELDAEDIHERLFTPAADLPEGIERVAIKSVHVNKCPVLAPATMLKPAEADRLQLHGPTLRRHRDALLAQRDAVAAKLEAVFTASAFQPHSDPEQDLYGGFPPDADRGLCERFRADPATLPSFADARLQTLATRYRARHFPQHLDAHEQAEWERWRRQRLEFAPDGGLTLDAYEQHIQALASELAGQPDKLALLAELRTWGQRLRGA